MKIENLNLSHLKYFLDVVETKSFTQAAEINYVTRPAISHALQRLEEWSGKQLVLHQKKKFVLTKEGQQFFQYSKQAYNDMKVAFERGVFDSGVLRIGCSASLMDNFLIPYLPKLNLQSTHIKTGTSSHLKTLIENGDINIAISINDENILGFETHILKKGSFILASRNGIFSNTLVTTEDRSEVREFQKYILRKHMTVINHLKAESWSLCAKVALASSAACLVPDILVQSKLRPISTPGFKSTYQVVLTCRSSELLSQSESMLIELLKSNL